MARTLEDLAICLESQACFDEAQTVIREAIALHVCTRGPDHPETINAHHNVGRTLLALGRVPETIEVFDERAWSPTTHD
ncbi:MAG: tetratricopeptide repeat protein [Myxococcota bacterium]